MVNMKMKLTKMKMILSIGLAIMLSLSPAAGFKPAASTGGGPAATAASEPGKAAVIKSKEEVIYATLAQDGGVNGMYAVNHFVLTSPGSLVDHGEYTSVKNLTDTTAVVQTGSSVSLQAVGENFYYQGDMAGRDLPWKIQLSYLLDGVKTNPQELGGKSGNLQIKLQTRQNSAVDPTYYHNYMLQITLKLDSEKCSNIIAPGATAANAGKIRMLVYTVLPAKDADISISAYVRDFSMAGVEIAAMPFSMGFELPDTNRMMDDFSALSDGVAGINDGVSKLEGGVAGLKNNAGKLTEGSAGFKSGISTLSGNSGQLLAASAQISGALNQIASSLDAQTGGANPAGTGPAGADTGDLTQLPQALTMMVQGLNEISGGLIALKGGFAPAYAALDAAMAGISDAMITKEQIAEIYSKTDPSQHAVLDRLVAFYGAGRTVKGTYDQVKAAFDAVVPTVDTLSASIDSISTTLGSISQQMGNMGTGSDLMTGLAQLSAGLKELDRNYATFHLGLGDYTNGVTGLTTGYGDFHQGLSLFSNYISEVYDGVVQLHAGTEKLSKETAKIPDTLKSEIDEILNQYTASDFVPVSFTSKKNEKTELVQFVIKGEGIEKPKIVTETGEANTKKTFWERLKGLFVR